MQDPNDVEADKATKKYTEYAVKVDPNQDDKATELKLTTFTR
eukprot:CAMPEP_0172488410 /NCGR_PEP_ID=MMETSP1066-20121228/17914_1 /TAXON_ID=671091 /ORGANISM="Coscinodiscus wailesii, Strain CCMP2513" /LENGTH=41 /DNA_ID= /DNA_START= /DNA_END= /DNA_ORIENTATION=